MITLFEQFINESNIHSQIKKWLYNGGSDLTINLNSAVAELTIEQLDDGEMTIHILEIYDNNKGSGNVGRLIDQLMKFSELNNIPLSLRSSTNNNINTDKTNSLSQEKLIKAYQRLGFKISEEDNRFETDITAPFMVYNY